MKRASIEELIARSSLGTPHAVAVRQRAPRDVVERVLDRVRKLDAADRQNGDERES